jgi:hypothetical protein
MKLLAFWLESPYCRKRGITKDTVAPIVKNALKNSNWPSAGSER